MKRYGGLKPFVGTSKGLRTDPGIDEDIRPALIELNQAGLKTFSSEGGPGGFVVFQKVLDHQQKLHAKAILDKYQFSPVQFWDIPASVFGQNHTEANWRGILSREFPDQHISLRPIQI